MNQIVKKVLIGALGTGCFIGALFGGLMIFRNVSRKPVNVYPAKMIVMTDYYEDAKEMYGTVTADRLQNVFLSSTETVTQTLVQEGQQVKKGDPLFLYDTTLTELNLKKADNSLLQSKRDLENAKKDLEKLKRTKPYQAPKEIIPAEPVVPEANDTESIPDYPINTPRKLGGDGTKKHPLIYVWGENNTLSDRFFSEAINEVNLDAKDEDDESNAEMTEPTEEDVLVGSISQNQTDSNATASDVTKPSVKGNAGRDAQVWLILESFENDRFDKEPSRIWGVYMKRESGRIYMSLFEPTSEQLGMKDEETEDGGFDDMDGGSLPSSSDDGPVYTKEELASAINNKQKEIRDLELTVKLAEVDLKRMKEEIGDGKVYAKMDGIVKKVADPEDAYKNSKAFITISQGGGYNVQVAVNEFLLDTFQAGQKVQVTSNENGDMAEGTVQSVSKDPTSENSFWGMGNDNTSYYPCTIFVSEDAAELKENDFVTVSYEDAQSGSGRGVYLDKMFIRSDVSGSYIFVKGKDGLLEKRNIAVGKDTGWGMIEIKKGLSVSDSIAFPYGSNVVEAAKTRDADVEDLYT